MDDGDREAESPAPSREWVEVAESEPVDPEAVLATVEELEVRGWRPPDADAGEIRHLGPAPGAFHERFGLGRDPEHVAAADLDGVALAAIQGLAARVETQQDCLERQAHRIEEQDQRLREQAATIDDLRDDVESLRATVESIVSGIVGLRSAVRDDRPRERSGRR